MRSRCTLSSSLLATALAFAPCGAAYAQTASTATDPLHGIVRTLDGRTFEGFLRLGDGLVAFGDLLGAERVVPAAEGERLRRLRAAADPEADLAARSLVEGAVRFVWERDDVREEPDTLSTSLPLLDVVSLVRTGDVGWDARLRSGETIALVRLRRRWGQEMDSVHVRGQEGVSLALERVSAVELTSPAAGVSPPAPLLHGTVTDVDGTSYTGVLVWRGVPSEVTARVPVADATVRFSDVDRIVADRRQGGEAVHLRGVAPDAPPGFYWAFPTLDVTDPGLGRVRLSRDRIAEVRFHPPVARTPDGGATAVGTVLTLAGESLSGHISWGDEAVDGGLVQGEWRDVTYWVDLSRVRRLAPRSPETLAVTLADGRTLTLAGRGASPARQAVVVQPAGDGDGRFVSGLDLESVELEGAGSSSPAAEGAAADPGPEAPPADTYGDAAALRLHASALAAAGRVERDLLAYTAVVRERAAVDLRLPLRDRNLYRTESASRVFWSRDGDLVVQVIAAREREPGDAEPEAATSFRGDLHFDPVASRDRLTFGLMDEDEDEDVWFHHPLAPDAGVRYRFETGDTLALSLPDGRTLHTVELRVLPREADPRRIAGSLWIEPESGALVRAVYRMAEPIRAIVEDDGEEVYIPGIFRPLHAEFTLATVDYQLWDFRVWLPRSMRAEGTLGAGIVTVPAAFEVSYRMESVVLGGDLPEGAPDAPSDFAETRRFATRSEALRALAEHLGGSGEAFVNDDETQRRVRGRRASFLIPEDPEALLRSPELPPPVWETAPGFPTEAELEEMADVLSSLPLPQPAGVSWAFNWGHERPDLLRYNRVEGLGVGARFEARAPTPLGPVTAGLQGFVGLSDRDPKARLSLEHESLRRRVSLAGYRELEPVSRTGRHLGLGNTVSAFLFGRDEGEYFMATGGELRVRPPSAERAGWDVRLYAERHAAVETNASFALGRAFDDGWDFRPNLAAEPVTELGAALLLSPWWGADPLAPRGGMEVFLHGAGGTREWGRASLTLRGAVPLPGRLSLGAEAGAGESWGSPPVQRGWFIGGSHTLRGYDPSVLAGPAFARARLDLQRTWGALGLSVFGDAGWAGAGLDAFAEEEALVSAGLGVSLLGGVLRFDLARALRAPTGLRLHLYLDGIH